MALAEKQEYYTSADYLTWDTDDRYELIDGVPYLKEAPYGLQGLMSPGPSISHQNISGNLFFEIKSYLQDKKCNVFIAPTDVLLDSGLADEADEADTVVQPDVFVVCDKDKIGDQVINGAPDLVIEIISKSTGSYDRGLKLQRYIDAGVREYWIVDPDGKIVQVYTPQDDGSSKMITYDAQDTVQVGIFEDLRIELAEIFTD
jgi:Uma2 family endonuclease